MEENKIVLWTTHCPNCQSLAAMLDAKKIQYDIVDDEDTIIESGITSVPTLEVNGTRMSLMQAYQWVKKQ